MKVCELRAFMKERRARGYSVMRKEELKERVRELKEAEKDAKYEKQLKKPFAQRAWKNKKFSAKSMKKSMINDYSSGRLVCECCRHANFACDGDKTFCVNCGADQEPNVDYDRSS